MEKSYHPHSGLCHLSTIPLKNLYLFKIAESVISFCIKKISDLVILNKWKSFSGMVDYVTCSSWELYNFSMNRSIKRKLRELRGLTRRRDTQRIQHWFVNEISSFSLSLSLSLSLKSKFLFVKVNRVGFHEEFLTLYMKF